MSYPIPRRRAALAVTMGLMLVSALAPAGPAAAGPPMPIDPNLTDHAPLHMAGPPPSGDSFTYRTTPGTWSAVAVQPAVTGDVDLKLYDDNWSLLASSSAARGVTDFVAVDSSRRAAQQYRPVAVPYSGGDHAYTIELAQGAAAVRPSWSSSFSVDPAHIVEARDVVLDPDQCAIFQVWGMTHNTGGLYVLVSDPATPARWVRSLGGADRSFTFGPADAVHGDYYDPKWLTFRAPDSAPVGGHYGLVITARNDGSGQLLRYEVVPATSGCQ